MNFPETYQQERKETFAREGMSYPGRALVKMELEPGYERAKNHLLPHIRSINEAHLIMLAEQKILSAGDAAKIMRALEDIDDEAYRTRKYDGRFEDLYFEMEDELIRKTDGTGGSLHLARSRNDMCTTWAHMAVRDGLLAVIERLIRFQNAISLFAEEHKDTLCVIHTHTQHAQPGLFGHYFLGVVDVIDRDIGRLFHAYAQVNSSPMGAAAITTSGFPISRQRVAELSGFESVIENAYDAIGNCDYFTETASAVSLCALNLGRVVADLLLWATEELKVFRVADGYISTSSIMPQKRNPIALEHLRASLSAVKGLSDTVELGYFRTPYGDISDHEDIEDTMSRTLDLLCQDLELFEAVIATAEVDRELLAARAYESFSVVTEIADQMYRSYQIPFRKAHQFVTHLVKKAEQAAYNLKNISREFFAETYQEFFGEPFLADFAPILQSIDPHHFVNVRNVYGGTGPDAMADMIAGARRKVMANAQRYEEKCLFLKNAQEKRARAVQSLLKR